MLATESRVSPDPNRPLPDLRLPVNPERRMVVEWARRMVAEGIVCWDTETTDVRSPEICEIAMVLVQGDCIKTLIDERVKPIAPIEEGATAVHGIRDEDVADARSFPAVWADILQCTDGIPHLTTYNREFDIRAVRCSAWAHGQTIVFNSSKAIPGTLGWPAGGGVWCLMMAYARWVGDYRIKANGQRYKNPTTVKLPDYGFQAHSALGDSLSKAALIQELAGVEI